MLREAQMTDLTRELQRKGPVPKSGQIASTNGHEPKAVTGWEFPLREPPKTIDF
jgi:hypothetical protein